MKKTQKNSPGVAGRPSGRHGVAGSLTERDRQPYRLSHGHHWYYRYNCRRQGEEGHKFYIVRRGVMDVLVRDEVGEQQVAVLGPGDFFGEAALITGEPRDATVVAREPTELYALDKESFRAAIESSASFHEQLRDVFFRRQ